MFPLATLFLPDNFFLLFFFTLRETGLHQAKRLLVILLLLNILFSVQEKKKKKGGGKNVLGFVFFSLPCHVYSQATNVAGNWLYQLCAPVPTILFPGAGWMVRVRVMQTCLCKTLKLFSFFVPAPASLRQNLHDATQGSSHRLGRTTTSSGANGIHLAWIRVPAPLSLPRKASLKAERLWEKWKKI